MSTTTRIKLLLGMTLVVAAFALLAPAPAQAACASGSACYCVGGCGPCNGVPCRSYFNCNIFGCNCDVCSDPPSSCCNISDANATTADRFASVDQNKDGKASLEEVTAWAKEYYGADRMKSIDVSKAFKDADKDGDSFITKSESGCVAGAK